MAFSGTDELALLNALEANGVTGETAENVLEAVLRVERRQAKPHSAMTPHEAQDWLAANDRSGADFWRNEPLSEALIAVVGEHLEAGGDDPLWYFDEAWQDQYMAKDANTP